MPSVKKIRPPKTVFPAVLATFSILLSIAIIVFSPSGAKKTAVTGSSTTIVRTSDLAEGKEAETNSAPTETRTLFPEYSPEAPSTGSAGLALRESGARPGGRAPGVRGTPLGAALPGNGPGAQEGKASLIIVIDDAGYSLEQLQAFLDLPFPLTIAVLPSLPHSSEAAARVLAAGKELIMHQPMQARDGQDPGPRALRLGMSAGEVERILEENMATVPGIVGMNNHMGSAVSEDAAIMTTVMELAKRKGIYYLDSLTTSGSATREVARRINLRHWERDVFLDNTPDRASIIHAMDEGKKIASSNGAAVMIGHVWSADLARTLMEIYPGLVEEGYSLSSIARFMMNQSDPEFEDDAGSGD